LEIPGAIPPLPPSSNSATSNSHRNIAAKSPKIFLSA
jgi:hypothetical protein